MVYHYRGDEAPCGSGKCDDSFKDRISVTRMRPETNSAHAGRAYTVVQLARRSGNKPARAGKGTSAVGQDSGKAISSSATAINGRSPASSSTRADSSDSWESQTTASPRCWPRKMETPPEFLRNSVAWDQGEEMA